MSVNLGRVAFVAKGSYDAATTYQQYDYVTHNNGSYVYISPIPAAGKPVTDAGYWQPLIDPAGMNNATEAANTAATKAETNAQTAATAAETANTAAAAADEARQNIQSDLAQKAPAIFLGASGEIVTITDGAAMPVKSLITHIEPVQEGEGDPSPVNKRPISGWDSVTVQVSSRNLLNTASLSLASCRQENGGFVSNIVNGYFCSATSTALKDFLLKSKGQSFTFSIDKGISGCLLSVIIYGKRLDGSTFQEINSATGAKNLTFVVSEDFTSITGIELRWNRTFTQRTDTTTSVSYLQLVCGNDVTYDPHQGQTLTATLPETVYGGTLDWTTGVLLTDGLLIDAGTLNWSYWYGNMFYAPTNIYINDVLCDIYPPGSLAANGVFLREEARGTIYIRDTSLTDGAAGAAELKQKLSGHKIFYKKEFPVEYQLTPQQLETLKGTNNIWSDAGATEVTYAVDTKMYADGKDSKTMIAPVEHGMVASRNYNIGDLLVAQNTLYRATVAIANGETIVPGSNCKETTVSENLGGGGGSGGNYVLPIASADTLGGVKVGDGLQMDGDALGVVKKEYELLQNTYVEVDDLAIIRLSDIMLQKILVSVDSGNVRSAFSARTIIRAGTKDIFNTADAVCADSKRQITKYYIAKQDGLVDIKALTPTAPGGLSDVKMYSDEVKSIDDITRITVTPSVSGTYFPRGLTVQVWGVRA